MSKKLHIISFDVPYPPNYGGIIDVYYKIKEISALGVKVVLHTYEYGKGEAKELEEICEKVYYYKKRNYFHYLCSNTPLSIRSRNSKLLSKRLQGLSVPVIFEGLKTTYSLINEKQRPEQIYIRSHNIEHDYLTGLARSETSFLRRMFFKMEARKLKRYEKVMQLTNGIFSISPHDHAYFNHNYKDKSHYLPVFHANNKVKKITGKGQYSLYHGDLRVSDNLRAAHFLIDVFVELEYPLIIAGGIKIKSILKKIKRHEHIKFVLVNPQEDMSHLIEGAHINILPSFQKTGIKLKLINALFNGRFCLVNKEMIVDTGLENLCHIAVTKADFRREIKAINQLDYTLSRYTERKDVLSLFDNHNNAKKLLKICGYTTS